MEIKAVVFDLDHTLFDRYKTIAAGVPLFIERFSSYLTPKIEEKQICKLLCDSDKLYIYHGWRRIFEYLCDNGMFSSSPDYSEYRNCMLEIYSHVAVPFTFTVPLLKELRCRGYKIGLITNGQSEIQRSKIAMLGIEKYFDKIIIGGEFGIQKPNVEPFIEMAKSLGESPNEMVYVGDNPINDVDASRNANYIPIQVLTANCPMDEYVPAKYQINSVAELLPILETINIETHCN